MQMSKHSDNKNRTSWFQWCFALLFVGLFLFLLGLPFWYLPKGGDWLIAAVLLLPLIPVLESLLLTPVYTLTGRFSYYSPLLLATKSEQGLDLHMGTLYDYLSQLRWRDRGLRSQRHSVLLVLQGLLSICDAVAEGKLSADNKITATSYFFSSRSVNKLGFTLSKGAFEVKLNLALVYLSLILRLSFMKGRWSLPDLKRVRCIHTTAGELLQHRSQIAKMLVHLQRNKRVVNDE